MTWLLKTSAFAPNEEIPKLHTCDGPDRSPALEWEAPPAGTKSLALICDDPDAPVGTWVHWVIFNLPAEARSLSEGVPAQEKLPNGVLQGVNDFKRVGYGGPCPPRGPAHRYFFKLYALDAVLPLGPRATKADVERAMKGHILAEAQLMGRYRRA